MAERDERLYLTEVLDAANRAIGYGSDGRPAFFADPRTQDAVVRNIEIIGEEHGRGLPENRVHPAPRAPRAPRRCSTSPVRVTTGGPR
jgi:uncharacterized protein with HEPN domain